MNTYTDTQLLQALAKMLREHMYWDEINNCLYYKGPVEYRVLDTELLHLCWFVEETLDGLGKVEFAKSLQDQVGADETDDMLSEVVHATWQQRTIALAKTLGVEIV